MEFKFDPAATTHGGYRHPGYAVRPKMRACHPVGWIAFRQPICGVGPGTQGRIKLGEWEPFDEDSLQLAFDACEEYEKGRVTA